MRRLSCSAWFNMRHDLKISLILFLLGVWSVYSPPATAQDETLTGWFSFIVADYPSESDRDSEITYGLTDDLGQYHELLIDIELMQPFGGPIALNRKRVTVEGEWEEVGSDETEKFWVYSIEVAASPSTASQRRSFAADSFSAKPAPSRLALPAAETNSHVRGSQAWVTILCRFGDSTNVTPYPVSYYEGLMGASDSGLAHYWRELSYGKINLTGSKVAGWYNLPRPRSYYVYDRDGDGEEDFDSERLVQDCIAAGDSDVFFPDFWGINLVFNQYLGIGGFATGRRLTKDGQERFYGITATMAGYGGLFPSDTRPHPSDIQPRTIAHEMGHVFGLPHSSGPYDRTYDSEWDVMSGVACVVLPDPEYGCVGVHTIAYHKDLLGWIPPARKYVAPRNSTRTITLERLAQPGAEGYLMAQIPIGDSPTDFYTVETRLFAGYDDGIPGEAVVIHKVDTMRGRPAQVVDIDNNGDPNDGGAMWTEGEIFTDMENDVQVSIDAVTATGYQVTISREPSTFISTCIDFLSPSPPTFGPDGSNASIQVEATESCAWSVTSNNEWIRVTSSNSGSGSGSVSYSVAANTKRTARTGTLAIDGWLFTVTQAGLDYTPVFEEDMENGKVTWAGESPWTHITTVARSGVYAWTDSPGGSYQNNERISIGFTADLTGVASATLTFWHRFDFASGDSGSVSVSSRQTETSWRGKRIRSFTGTQTAWQHESIDLSRFAGNTINISFNFQSDAMHTADGWYIDDVAVFSSDFDTPQPIQALLENPSPESSQSGVAAISGWACEAQNIVIELNGVPYRAGYPTTRPDTLGRCGDTDNGFSLLWNWNNLGAGTHTVQALIDGVEFANTTVRVTTFGEDPFPRGWSGTFDLPNFPTSGETTVVQWAESLQNFVITDGQPNTGEGYNRVAGIEAILGNPSLGSAQSGVGVISGWACEAEEIVIELNGVPYRAGYPTTRPDTLGRCGDTDNGFSLLWNWNNLGAGTHTVRALIDGVEFANTTVHVTTFGEDPFPRGWSGTFPIPDFPRPGENKRLRWEESLQNFVIIP